MKRIILTNFACALVAVLVYSLLPSGIGRRSVVWQYDAWRARYAAEVKADEERKVAEAKAEITRKAERAKWEKEHPGGNLLTDETGGPIYFSSGITATNSIAIDWVISNNSFWQPVRYATIGPNIIYTEIGKPEFEPGTLELGYRSDGIVLYRKPPELVEAERAEELKKKVAMLKTLANAMIDGMTNQPKGKP